MESTKDKLEVLKSVLEGNKSKNHGGGISLPAIVAAVFITLKMTGAVNWSWLWVLAPLWIPFSVAIVLLILIMVFMCILVKMKN